MPKTYSLCVCPTGDFWGQLGLRPYLRSALPVHIVHVNDRRVFGVIVAYDRVFGIVIVP